MEEEEVRDDADGRSKRKEESHLVCPNVVLVKD